MLRIGILRPCRARKFSGLLSLRCDGVLGNTWNLISKLMFCVFQRWLPNDSSSILPHWPEHLSDNYQVLRSRLPFKEKSNPNWSLELAVLKHSYCNYFDSCFLLSICTNEIGPRHLTGELEPNKKCLLPLSGSALVHQRDHLVSGHQEHKKRNQKY